MRSTFKTVCYVNGSKEKNGMSSSWDGLQSTGLSHSSVARRISKDLWDAKGNRAKGKSPAGGDGELCA